MSTPNRSAARRVAVTGRGSRSRSQLGNDITDARLPVARFAGSSFRVTVIDDAGKRAWTNPV